MAVLASFTKTSDSVLDYSFDWSDWLGDSLEIATSTWDIPDDLTLDTSTASTTLATAYISGGINRASYQVVNKIVTNGDNPLTVERSFKLTIED